MIDPFPVYIYIHNIYIYIYFFRCRVQVRLAKAGPDCLQSSAEMAIDFSREPPQVDINHLLTRRPAKGPGLINIRAPNFKGRTTELGVSSTRANRRCIKVAKRLFQIEGSRHVLEFGGEPRHLHFQPCGLHLFLAKMAAGAFPLLWRMFAGCM